MTYQMYLLDIRDLEDKSLSEEAMALIDDQRRSISEKYSKEKDRLRAIAAGLLLQVGFMELSPKNSRMDQLSTIYDLWQGQKIYDGGMVYKLSCRALVAFLQKYQNTSKMHNAPGPIPLTYGKGVHGKPFWDGNSIEKEYLHKKYWYFNLSHSGDYVVLAVADCEVGVDVQEERAITRFPGGFQAFSRMESFVKCTGEGYAHGCKKYEEYQGNVPGYRIERLEMEGHYVLHICMAEHSALENFGE